MRNPVKIVLRRRSLFNSTFTGTLACVCLAAVAAPARAVLLYDVDFEAPVHTLGAPPTLGQEPAPRKTVTMINFGTPTIAQEAGVLDGQFLRLSSTGSYEQVSFGLGSDDGGFAEQYPYYLIQSDLTIQELTDQFRYHVDGPTAHNVRFTSVGGLVAVALGVEGYEEPIGTYEFGARISLDVRVDRQIERWTIRIDNEVVFTGDYPIYTLHGMRTVRPALIGEGTVDLDNVRIWGLPEPGSLLLLAGGTLALGVRRRRRPS
jgi:hypothetical protein